MYPELEHFPDRPTEVKNAFCSSYKIKKDFNYNASVPLDKTLTEMINWIKPIREDFDYHLPIEIENLMFLHQQTIIYHIYTKIGKLLQEVITLENIIRSIFIDE